MNKQVNIKVDEKFLAQIDRYISKQKPRINNRTHFFELAATEFMRSFGGGSQWQTAGNLNFTGQSRFMTKIGTMTRMTDEPNLPRQDAGGNHHNILWYIQRENQRGLP